MCSVFGFVARDGDRVNLKTLAAIVAENIRRGPHAFGFAWLDGRGRLRSYRQVGRLTEHLPLLRWLADARMLVGHLRWATQGDPSDNINNHPHPCDGGWLVHNGVVTNYAELLSRRGVYCSSECDSEAIAQLVEASAAPTLAARVAAAVRRTEGPLAVLGLWSRPGTLVAARRGNPLHWATTDEGLYFGSLAEGMPGKPKAAKDDQLTRVTCKGGRIVCTTLDLPARRGSDLFARSAGGLYRGG
jgi:glucosamine 6-phosphate synthetase-like amidotransferase/phosphosugar isomerase protein